MSFKKIESQSLPDIHSTGHLYQHEETGAQVLYLENQDKNKSFTIGFKTPPYSDNGITHIIEHSVLNGSAKYPSKEPFVELIKGSMNTFVNAMTFSDKTIYPVASTNDQDFKNLMEVYLDAVFAPKFKTNPQILSQEGWHYHLEKAEDELILKGVVYNEMKGATASPDAKLYYAIARTLYPESIYQYESGGLPAAIPELTQEEFVAYHDQYYHPSNSLTVLYGDLDLEQAFQLLEEYFEGKGQKEAVDLSFEVSLPEVKEVVEPYSLTEGDDPSQKDYLSLAWHLAPTGDILESMAYEVLEEILLGNLQSPLKKALLEAEVAGEISGGQDAIGYPQVFMVMAKYTSADKMDRFKQVVKETLSQLVELGIDRQLIQASINKIAFRLKESVISESRPRGILYTLSAYQTWLYDQSPFGFLSFDQYLKRLSEKAEDQYFEALIREKLLDNPHQVAITLTAEPGLSDRKEADLHKELQAYKTNLDQEALAQIVSETQALLDRQESEDRPEDLAKIPSLTKEDLSTETEEFPLMVSDLADFGGAFYHAEQFTSGIDYLSLALDIRDLKSLDYRPLSLLAKLLGRIGTVNLSTAQLQQEIDLHTGGIHADLDILASIKGEIHSFFTLNGKALEGESDHLLHLMHEIFTASQLNNSKEILALIQEEIAGFENKINFGAHALAYKRALSQFKVENKLEEYKEGIDFFYYLKECRDLFQADRGQEVIMCLQEVYQQLMNRARIFLFYTGSKERASSLKQQISSAFSHLTTEPLHPPYAHQAGQRQKEAFLTAQDVNYVALASQAKEDLSYSGVSQVLANQLNFGYLWNTIRVKGGAYGCFYSHGRLGSVGMGSYRDPNIHQTIECYLKTPEYVEALDLSESELVKNIIGTLSPLERPKSAIEKGVYAWKMHWLGIDSSDLKKLKEEIIQTTNDQLADLANPIANALADHTLVVIGNKAKIENEQEHFDSILELY